VYKTYFNILLFLNYTQKKKIFTVAFWMVVVVGGVRIAVDLWLCLHASHATNLLGDLKDFFSFPVL
jgi:hypothetical protein